MLRASSTRSGSRGRIFRRAGRPLLLAACSEKSQSLADYIAAICAAHFRDASRAESPFLAENDSAMAKMMTDMDITPSGDVDRDFVAMMVPHHQGAIDMAQAELRYGHNELLRRIAQEIIVTQQQEIAAMRLALGQPYRHRSPSPDRACPPRAGAAESDAAIAALRSPDMKRVSILARLLAATALAVHAPRSRRPGARRGRRSRYPDQPS